MRDSTSTPPSVQEVEERIRHAERAMAEMSLAPEYPRPPGATGYTPAVYTESGDRHRPAPLRFSDEQGWEVATDEGRQLDMAIRSVGAGIEARSMMVYRRSSELSLDQIIDTRRDLRERSARVLDIAARKPGGDPAVAPGSDVESLTTALGFASSKFRTQEEYEVGVSEAMKRVGEASTLKDDPPPGTPFGGMAYWDRDIACKNAQEALRSEQEKLLSGDERQSAWAMNEARLDSEARLKALAEIRPMGEETYGDEFIYEGPGVESRQGLLKRKTSTVTPWTSEDYQAVRAVDSTARVLPRDWVGRVSEGRLEVRRGERSVWRLPLKPGGEVGEPKLTLSATLKPSQGPMTGWESDALHEMGHHLGHVYPEINQIARTHKALRTTDAQGNLQGIEAFPLGDPEGEDDPPGRMDEWDGHGSWIRRGQFAAPYAGTETAPWNSEVFSTGLEAALGGRYGALRGHGGVKADPEHLHLILGLLATVGRR